MMCVWIVSLQLSHTSHAALQRHGAVQSAGITSSHLLLSELIRCSG